MKIKIIILLCLCGALLASSQWSKLQYRWLYRDLQWSETADRVRTKIDTQEKVLALTMDACGSTGDSLDENLINFLTEHKIPATVFITGKWIDKYPEKFQRLAKNPLIEIENHGQNHRPASLTGNSIYGIEGTANGEELYAEVKMNADKIEQLTGRRPIFYRSGTAYYDERATQMIEAMGFQSIGFSILGDKGATYSAKEVEEAFLQATAGDIIICHMNHPEKETGKGVMAVLPKLIEQGFTFVQLKDYRDKLK